MTGVKRKHLLFFAEQENKAMILWAVLMAVLFAAFIGGIFYLISRLRKFQWLCKAAGGRSRR